MWITIAPGSRNTSRYSGRSSPVEAAALASMILSDKAPKIAKPMNMPMPTLRKARPTMPEEKPYCVWNTTVMVVNMRYRYPYTTAMNMASRAMMWQRKSSFIGRTKACLNAFLGERPRSSFERRFGLLVFFRRRRTFSSRIVGAYFSRRTTAMARVMKAIQIAITQNSHLHPFAWTRHPPPTGPALYQYHLASVEKRTKCADSVLPDQ